MLETVLLLGHFNTEPENMSTCTHMDFMLKYQIHTNIAVSNLGGYNYLFTYSEIFISKKYWFSFTLKRMSLLYITIMLPNDDVFCDSLV